MKKSLLYRHVNCHLSPLSIDLSVFLITGYFSALHVPIKFAMAEEIPPF
jgi:hypothetical protein